MFNLVCLKIFVTQANSEIKRSEKDVFGCCMATRILKQIFQNCKKV